MTPVGRAARDGGGLEANDARGEGTMGRPKEREYVTMNCGNCYRSQAEAPEARFYTCTRCGDPTYECATCARIGKERELPGVTTCATCSLREEMHADAS